MYLYPEKIYSRGETNFKGGKIKFSMVELFS